jgi:signal transduction histidine kinase
VHRISENVGINNVSSTRYFRDICHDMRQAIATILALGNATIGEPQLPSAALARVNLIVDQAEWLADIIAQGLETSEQGRKLANRTDATRAVTEAVASAQLVWQGELDVVAAAGPVWISIHPVLLRRAVANLLDNAMRAAGCQGHIRVTAGSCPGWALIAIEDDGPGFGHIKKGHGLGLAAVTRSVIRHGGGIECTRSSLGGACVSLWLPLAPDQPAKANLLMRMSRRYLPPLAGGPNLIPRGPRIRHLISAHRARSSTPALGKLGNGTPTSGPSGQFAWARAPRARHEGTQRNAHCPL